MTAATTDLDPAFVDAWAERFLDAWNDLDGAAVAQLCADDVVWRDPATPEPQIGRNAVSDFVVTIGRAFADFHIEETAGHCLIPSQNRVLAPYRMTGWMTGPMEPFAPTGRKISVEGVDEWTFSGELLSGYRTYYDTIDVARQLGVMPAPGSRSERLMTRLQHGQARLQRRSARRART